MCATDEGTEDIKQELKLMRKKFQMCNNMNLIFGHLLLHMGHYSQAESYFQMMLQVMPNDHKDRAAVYEQIGDLHMRTTNWNEAFRNFTYAYERKKKSHQQQSMGITFNNFGNYYKAIEDFDMARMYYEKTLNCKNDSINTSITKVNLSNVYLIEKKYDEALNLCLQARDNLQQFRPHLPTEITYCQGTLGDIYFAQAKYDLAEAFYLTSFELSQKHLLIGDHLRTKCIMSLIDLYTKQNNKQRAFEFCKEQLVLHEQYLLKNHTSIAHLLLKLAELEEPHNNKIRYYTRALNLLEKNVYLEYQSLSKCLILIGSYWKEHNSIEKALEHFLRAKDIQTKIYPPMHKIFRETESLIDCVQ
ncbi:unnamed protein product [Rotaria sp. Silwood1]|nr:unnamed protein product [Rotaria sp. Silwood1]